MHVLSVHEYKIGGVLTDLILSITIKIQKRNSSNIISYFEKNMTQNNLCPRLNILTGLLRPIYFDEMTTTLSSTLHHF